MRAPLLLLALFACDPTLGPVPPGVAVTPTATTPRPNSGRAPLRFVGDAPTNLLFISLDTFRKDHMARYGSELLATPFLDQLANEGVALDDHMQCSNWTWAGTSCTLLGRTHQQFGFLPRLNGHKEPFPPGTDFLPHYLGQDGYFSLALSSNAWFSPNWNTMDGFDEQVFPAGGGSIVLSNNGIVRLKTAIDEGRAHKWFMHLHYLEPHVPYKPAEEFNWGIEDLPPLPFDLDNQAGHYAVTSQWPVMSDEEQALLEAHLRTRYAGEIRTLDDRIRQIFDTLDQARLLDDTLVVVWTDHGEAFWEHGRQTHAWYLNAEENDAIAIFWAKNIVPDAWDGPTTAIDIAPTVMDTLGLEVPSAMTGAVLGTADPDRPRFAVSNARFGVVQSVRQGKFKLNFSWLGFATLYNMNADPQESNDLWSADHPEYLRLLGLLQPQIDATIPLAPDKTVTYPTD